MGRKNGPANLKQLLLLGLTFVTVGSSAAFVLYSNAVNTVSQATKDRLLETAQIAALQVDVSQHSLLDTKSDVTSDTYTALSTDLLNVVGSVGDIERLYTVRQSDSGLQIVLNASNSTSPETSRNSFLSDIKTLPTASGVAWNQGITVVEDRPVESNGISVLRAFVPLFNSDRQVESLLVVELNYSSINNSLAQLKSGLWISLFGVLAVSTLLTWLLTRTGTVPRAVLSRGFSLHRKRRIWIAATLLIACVAILSDGAIGFMNLDTAGAEARTASRALQASRELQNELQRERTQGWAVRLDSLAAFYSESGQPWVANQIRTYRDSVATDSALAGAQRLKLMQAAQQDVARVQTNLSEAGGRIQIENSHQSIRLTVSVILGLSALILLSVISRQESRLEAALDENSKVQLEYQNLVGNLPIGLFAYSTGEVLFTNGAWGKNQGDKPDTVLSAIHRDDRKSFIEALDHAEENHEPFSSTIKIADKFGTTYYEAFCAPVIHTDGHLRHLLIFCVDVTPLVAAKNEVHSKHAEVEDKNRQLNAVLEQVEQSLHSTVETMIRAVEVKDPYTAGHSERVRQYSVWMGEHLSLSDFELRTLNHGARIHDVGKIGIPDAILTKPGGLTSEEFEIIKQHTIAGAKIVGNIELFRDCVPIVRWHHERLDGSGYPDQLAGEEVPFLVRIVAVADMFDAMTSNRSYRKGMATEDAIEIIARDTADGKLDAIAYKALTAVISEHGIVPQLDTGQTDQIA